MITRVITNHGTFYVNASPNSLSKWMYRYLRGYRRINGTLKGATYVMSQYHVTTPISTVPFEFREDEDGDKD